MGTKRECVLVSACLLGVRCRYDGRSKPSEEAYALLQRYTCVPFCPEQLGGLPTPRPKSHLRGGDGKAFLDGKAQLVNDEGHDVGPQFRRGAEESIRLAKLFGVKRAFLKQKSPSCGYGRVRIDGRMSDGVGVAAAALEREGIQITPIP